MREIKRILLHPLHIGLLALFVLLSAFYFSYQQQERFLSPKQTGRIYQEMIRGYQTMTPAKAQQKIEEESGMYQALGLLFAVWGQDNYDRIRADYEMLYPDLIAQLEAGEWTASNTIPLLSAYETVSGQMAHLNGYADYLKQIEENAESLQASSLFSKPGTFRYENIQKTREDYREMDASLLSIHPTLSAEAYQDTSGFFWGCGLLYLFFFCYLLFEERRCHMWESQYASRNGRALLAGKRIAALAAGVFLFLFFTHIARLLFSVFLYGGFDGSAYIQEISAYQECPYPISIGACFLIRFLLQWLGFILVGTMMAAICSWCANQSLAFIGMAAGLTVEYLLFTRVSDSSALIWLKYGNLFLFLCPELLFTKYLNLPFGSVPAALPFIYGVISFLFAVFGIGLFVLGMGGKRPTVPFQPWERICVWIRKRFPLSLRTGQPVFTEWKKSLLWKKGIVLLFLYGFTASLLIRPVSLYEAGEESALNFYYSEIEGPYDEAAVEAYLAQAQAWIEEGTRVLNDASEKLRSQEIGELEYTRLVLPWETLPGRIEGLKTLREEVNVLKNTDAPYLVNPFGYRWLFGRGSLWQKTILTVFQIAAVGIIQFLMITYDRQSDMRELLHAAPKGRGILRRRKYLAGSLTAVFFWGVEWATLFLIIARSKGHLGCLTAPISSLSFLHSFPSWLSIGSFIGLLAIFHLILLLLFVWVSSAFCYRMQK